MHHAGVWYPGVETVGIRTKAAILTFFFFKKWLWHQFWNVDKSRKFCGPPRHGAQSNCIALNLTVHSGSKGWLAKTNKPKTQPLGIIFPLSSEQHILMRTTHFFFKAEISSKNATGPEAGLILSVASAHGVYAPFHRCCQAHVFFQCLTSPHWLLMKGFAWGEGERWFDSCIRPPAPNRNGTYALNNWDCS